MRLVSVAAKVTQTNQTESSEGPRGLFIIQEMDSTNSSVSVWGGGEGRDARAGGVREQGWMDGK